MRAAIEFQRPAVIIGVVTFSAVLAASDPAEANPCAYKEFAFSDLLEYGLHSFQNPTPADTSGGPVVQTPLALEYANNQILGCPVKLRSYNGRLVGPTIRVKPGQTLEIDLFNNLPAIPEGTEGGPHQPVSPTHPWWTHNGAADFNITNFHAHGFWVTPSNLGDNVLRKMVPRGKEKMLSHVVRIEVPENHPPGTYWYHAHVHGSTSVQVSSGAAGALIIDPLPKNSKYKTGTNVKKALDHIDAIAGADEKIFVFQQIGYDEAGKIESLSLFNMQRWRDSKRTTLINGQAVPTIFMRSNEVQRWRFISAAIHEALHVQLEGHELHEIALDGLSTGRITKWGCTTGECPQSLVELYPGYRVDLMVKARNVAPGKTESFWLYDRAHHTSFVPSLGPDPERKIAFVVVSGPPLPEDNKPAPVYPDMPLPTAEDVADTKAHADLNFDAPIASPGKTIPIKFSIGNYYCTDNPADPCLKCDDVTGPTRTTSGFTAQCPADKGKREPPKFKFVVNGKPFGGEYTKVTDTVGATSDWVVETDTEHGHPFHIHVNPFMAERFVPVPVGTVGRLPDGTKKELVWKDTFFVLPEKQHRFRTQYREWEGKFVMHCHILDHEDKGMMILVELKK